MTRASVSWNKKGVESIDVVSISSRMSSISSEKRGTGGLGGRSMSQIPSSEKRGIGGLGAKTVSHIPTLGENARTTKVFASRDSAKLSKVEKLAQLRQSSCVDIEEEHVSKFRHKVAEYLFHPYFETFGGYVVLFNFIIMTMETHATATQDNSLMNFVKHTNTVLLVWYTLECGARLYATRLNFFRAAWNNLDFVIVVTGWVSEILEAAGTGGSEMEKVQMLKSLRLMRLVRLVRLLVAFKELYFLVAGISRCMKTLFWAGGLIFVVLNVWAILSVELLDDRVQELHARGAFGSCSWCAQAFTNIWRANLTWFQIISTADWSVIGRPLSEAYVWPYLLFVLNVFVVVWGLLNLIVAAIVDASIAAREDDVAIAADIAEQSHDAVWDSFSQLCKEMDANETGIISIDGFKKFWHDNHELQQHLTIMGVQEKNIEELLQLMDLDESGTLETNEFIEEFTAMRTLVEKTTLYYLLKFAKNIQTKINHQTGVIHRIYKDISAMKSSSRKSAAPSHSVGSDHTMSEMSSGVSNGVGPKCSKDESLRAEAAGSKSADASQPKFCTQDEPRLSIDSEDTVMPPIAEGEATGGSSPTGSATGLKMLPHGWYYFGSSLPAEASSLCTAIAPTFGVGSTSHFQSYHSEECPVSADGQTWEPVPSSGASLQDYRIKLENLAPGGGSHRDNGLAPENSSQRPSSKIARSSFHDNDYLSAEDVSQIVDPCFGDSEFKISEDADSPVPPQSLPPAPPAPTPKAPGKAPQLLPFPVDNGIERFMSLQSENPSSSWTVFSTSSK